MSSYTYTVLFRAACLLTMILASLLCRLPSAAAEPPTTEELQGVVDLMEDPIKRDAFVKELKALIQARKELEPPSTAQEERKSFGEWAVEILAVEDTLNRFERLSQRIADAADSTLGLLLQTPAGLRTAAAYLRDPENGRRLLEFLGSITGAVVIGLLIWVGLRGTRERLTRRMVSLPTRLFFGCIRLMVALLPWAVLWSALVVFFRVFPYSPPAHAVALLIFAILFFYRAAVETLRLLFAPDHSPARLLPAGDENANYYWVWGLRFARFTAFYWIVLQVLAIANVQPQAISFIRAVLLFWCPLLLSIFILQLGREIRRHTHLPEPPETIPDTEDAEPASEQAPEVASRSGFHSFVSRHWVLPALIYCWGIFGFLIFRYEEGFHYLLRATVGTTILVFSLFLAVKLVDGIFDHLFSVHHHIRSRFPGLEEKTNRYIRWIRNGIKIFIGFIALGVVAQIWGVPTGRFIQSETGGEIILRIFTASITVGLMILLIEATQVVCSYLLKEKRGRRTVEISQKQKTLIPVIGTAIQISAAFVGGIVILGQLGVNTTPILAGAGIVGLAVGFGSQTLVKDLINGMFILFEESIRVGDWAMVGAKGGAVESVGLRTVKLRDLNGTVHVIPNSTIDVLSNYSKHYSRSVMDIGIAYRENVDEVIAILEEIGAELQQDPEHGKDILEPLEVFGLDRFEDSAVVIRIRIKTRPLKQWGVRREFYRRMKRVFDERGIEIPFPHRTLYMGEPKEGPAPPVYVRLGKDASEPADPHGAASPPYVSGSPETNPSPSS